MDTESKIRVIREAIRLMGYCTSYATAWGQRSYASGLLTMCEMDGSISFQETQTLRQELEEAFSKTQEGK